MQTFLIWLQISVNFMFILLCINDIYIHKAINLKQILAWKSYLFTPDGEKMAFWKQCKK